MKLSCEVVQDLLPLYEDNLCSPASREIVEEHLRECSDCKAQMESVRNFDEPEIPVQVSGEDRAIAKSFRKIYRRWSVSLIAMLLVVPMLLLTVNQIRGIGICFTNVDDILIASRYVHALENGDFEKAAACMDYEIIYNDILELLAMEPEDHGAKYVPVSIGETEWAATDYFYQQHLQYENDPSQIWRSLIFNYIPQTMIPENIWNEIITQEPEMVQEINEEEYIINSISYVRFETKWGTYFTDSTSSILDCVTAPDFCKYLELVPIEIYQEAEAELKQNTINEYQRVQKDYGEVNDMSLEEFKSILSAKYTSELQVCENQGISFESTGYERSYYHEEIKGWHIEYGVQVTHNGVSYPLTIDFYVRDGHVNIYGTGISAKFAALDTVSEALFMHYID